jgi:hypothetical protein
MFLFLLLYPSMHLPPERAVYPLAALPAEDDGLQSTAPESY